jgi:hypothetical protein
MSHPRPGKIVLTFQDVPPEVWEYLERNPDKVLRDTKFYKQWMDKLRFAFALDGDDFEQWYRAQVEYEEKKLSASFVTSLSELDEEPLAPPKPMDDPPTSP